MKIVEKTAHTSQGKVFIKNFTPEGLPESLLNLKYLGFLTSEEVFDKYYEGSLFHTIGVPLQFLKTQVETVEETMVNHEYLWDGDSVPLTTTILNNVEEETLTAYGRKYSFSKAMQDVWVGLPDNVKNWALNEKPNLIDGLLCGGFGVQGLIHAADDKILTTVRSGRTINNGGMLMPSFNEGASLVDVRKNTLNMVDVFKRGMKEELNIEDLTNININVHTLMLDSRLYEWGLLAYVDATESSLTSEKLNEKLTAADDVWEFDLLSFHDFTPEVVKSFIDNSEAWVSHGLICATFSGMIVHPELETEVISRFSI
jgi:hypothetical protein